MTKMLQHTTKSYNCLVPMNYALKMSIEYCIEEKGDIKNGVQDNQILLGVPH